MDRHSSPLWSLLDPDPLSTIMIVRFPPAVEGLPDPTRCTSSKPILSRAFLLSGTTSSARPMPAGSARSCSRSRLVRRRIHADMDAYHFVFSEFVEVE